ncbi:nucleoside-diphosphate kinase [Mycobacterium sp. SM1]|nr:nucleoside-diphosphate kinase [Mycobacterium sp. SM1]
MTERTLLLIKPDAVRRCLIGEIISRIERKGLTIAALELKQVGDELARRHYAEHEGKPFFASLLEFITSGPVVAAVVEGPRAVAAVRQLCGATDPVAGAAPGTIRGDLGLEIQFNLVHGSDSADSAQREIALWFPDGPVALRAERDPAKRPPGPGAGPEERAIRQGRDERV